MRREVFGHVRAIGLERGDEPGQGAKRDDGGRREDQHRVPAQHFQHDAAGYVVTDDRMMTSIPGLFAAGDLRVQLVRQVTTAVGDATTAAIAVEKYLTERKQRAAAVAEATSA